MVEIKDALEQYTPDEVVFDGDQYVIIFYRYTRAVAFMEILRRYVPRHRSVKLVYVDNEGQIYVDPDILKIFAAKNPGIKTMKVV